MEDHPQLRGLLAEALDAAAYQVVEAWNGAQAISAIDELLPPYGHLGLVILDLRLPYGSGLDVLQSLIRRGTDVPVVAISADAELLKAAADSGAQATVSKPFELDDILGTVSRYCPLGQQVNDQAG